MRKYTRKMLREEKQDEKVQRRIVEEKSRGESQMMKCTRKMVEGSKSRRERDRREKQTRKVDEEIHKKNYEGRKRRREVQRRKRSRENLEEKRNLQQKWRNKED